jgi:hypothetical protein
MKLESFFDKANRGGTGIPGPPILYHYTSWDAAESILRSQRIRATAHDCTNDEAELTSADETIREAVRAAEETAQAAVTRRVLGLFLRTYEISRIGASRRAYLACFSTARDDSHQWDRYGNRGAGVCLGLRLFKIPSPRLAGITTSFMPVDYREDALREKVDKWLHRFVDAMDQAEDIERNWRLAIDSLNVSAAAWALCAKRAKWEPEQEVRAIYLAREGSRIIPVEEVRPDGSIKRYFPAPLTRLSRIPVEEFILGPCQDTNEGRRRALSLLTSAGYPNAESKIVVSTTMIPLKVPA